MWRLLLGDHSSPIARGTCVIINGARNRYRYCSPCVKCTLCPILIYNHASGDRALESAIKQSRYRRTLHSHTHAHTHPHASATSHRIYMIDRPHILCKHTRLVRRTMASEYWRCAQRKKNARPPPRPIYCELRTSACIFMARRVCV